MVDFWLLNQPLTINGWFAIGTEIIIIHLHELIYKIIQYFSADNDFPLLWHAWIDIIPDDVSSTGLSANIDMWSGED